MSQSVSLYKSIKISIVMFFISLIVVTVITNRGFEPDYSDTYPDSRVDMWTSPGIFNLTEFEFSIDTSYDNTSGTLDFKFSYGTTPGIINLTALVATKTPIIDFDIFKNSTYVNVQQYDLENDVIPDFFISEGFRYLLAVSLDLNVINGYIGLEVIVADRSPPLFPKIFGFSLLIGALSFTILEYSSLTQVAAIKTRMEEQE